MKNATQLNAKIKNIVKETGLTHEVVLRNYMLERVLERISQSPYHNHFIIKGGMLVASMVGIATRTTMDLDASLTGRTLNKKELEMMIKDIIAIPTGDNVVFTYEKIEAIKEASDYPGFRISLTASLERTRQRIKLDIATGDTITPKEVRYNYPMLFEDRTIPLMAYNVETVLSEKLETLLTRSTLNSRMRDFYDMYILQKTLLINEEHFTRAFTETITKREATQVNEIRKDIITEVLDDSAMQQSWAAYQKKFTYAKEVSWEMVGEAVWSLEAMLE